MKELKFTERQFQEIVDSYDTYIDGIDLFLIIETGDEGDVDMFDFAESIADDKLKIKLFNVLNGGRKIFRRFKDTLFSNGRELERYYHFVNNRNREPVMEWLESIGVRATEE